MQEQLTGLEARMLLEGSGKMGDRGIAQHKGDLRDTQALFIEQVAGMFHALTLVEIKDRGPEKLFEPFFEIAFVDGHLTAQLLDGQGFADMLQEDLTGLDDLFPVLVVG